MEVIKFDVKEREAIVKKVIDFFDKEIDSELSRFEAEFVLDFFIKEIGCTFYNKALEDVRALLVTKIEYLADSVYELEKPVNFK